jgi:GntR family carbon starvation induced transcriptional regulator
MSDGNTEWGPMSRIMPVRSKTLADEAFAKIRDEIVSGALSPGEKLQPDVLRERYAIGVSPVREALSRLAADGLTIAQGQRGFFVAPISVGELDDITDLRVDLSVRALSRSIRFREDTWESDLVGATDQLEKLTRPGERGPEFADEWERRNREFHHALGAGCQSPWLIHFCEVLYDQSERYRRQYVIHAQPRAELHEDHRIIMEAALSGDADVACAVLARHIRLGAASVRERILNAAKPPARGLR